MATKSSDRRYRIPTVSELLEMPAVRTVAERWNRSSAVAGVRSFLDQLRSDLERRASEMHLPSVQELAERAARHIARQQRPAVRSAINATGRLVDPAWIGRPLADEALEQFVAFGSSYMRPLTGDGQDPTRDRTSLAAALARHAGAEAAAVVHSYAGGVWITLAALAAEKELLVARADLGEVETNQSLDAVAASAAAKLREVGATNRASAADFESAVSDATAALLRHRSDSCRVVGESPVPAWEELVALARDRELPLIHAAGSASLINDAPVVGEMIDSIAADIGTGVSLVVARGDGLVGGPPCGLIVGSRALIGRIEAHPLFAALRIDPLRAAALEATLDAYDDPQQLAASVPLFQLLSTSVENLRQRAERLAPQLAQADCVEAAEAISTENPLGIACCGDRLLPSLGIALTPAGGDVAALDARLRAAPLPIIGRPVGERLVIDLRGVFPRQDQRLVDNIVGEPESAAECPPEVAAAH